MTGGVRSGKSRHAESLVSGEVRYVAPGPTSDDADWAARMHLAGGDADLAAHAELAAIGKLCRGIVQENGGIDFGEEALDDGRIFGAGGEGFTRINVACPRATLDAALDRLEAAVAAVTARAAERAGQGPAALSA